MNFILLTVVGALVLLWGGIMAFVTWVAPIEKKHVLGLGGYITVVSGLLIYLVIQTSITQQETALKDTRGRLSQELETFRDRLSQLTDKLMGQIAEKAELTQSEMEVRGNLQTERSQHARTREELKGVREQMAETEAELGRETDAHRAYLDSLNTERILHQSTRDLFQREKKLQEDTQKKLEDTRQELAKSRERAALQKAEVDRLQGNLKQAEARLQKALENAATAQSRLQEKFASQQKAVETLQAAVDSIYLKTLKRPRR